MPITVANRPGQLDGCWRTWQETTADNVARTEFETGNVKTRRRFTGVQRTVNASVTLPMSKYVAFRDWFQVTQRQGAIATRVKTPYNTEEVFQWQPPQYSFALDGTFTATVVMIQNSDF